MKNIIQLFTNIKRYIALRRRANNYLYLQRLFVFALLCCASFNLFAQHSGGGYAGSWNFRDMSARTIGLAGSFTAIADDPMAIFYNPAGLSNLSETPTIISSISMLGLGRSNSTFAWGQEVIDGLGIGIAFNNFYTGTFTARDAMGHAYGEYSNNQYAIAASASYKIAYASFGATAKYITDNLQGAETFSNGYAVDFGALFDMGMFRFGVQLQNASGFLFWNTAGSDIMNLPWRLKAGISTKIYTTVERSTDRSTVTGEIMTDEGDKGNALNIGLDFAYTQYSVAPVVSIGMEYEAHKYITFRGGMGIYGDVYGHPELFPMNQWAGGVSVFPDIDFLNETLPFKFSIDYSVANELVNATGINHTIALTIKF
ncbi:MAG: hypothetical protein LBO69_01970 [Ignavibacteria bacterium]|jgi:hypothetical protein|nr:hypothetical protein [Ignavibacteria bacterium]